MIYRPGPDPTVRHVIRRLICQFTRSSYLKPQEEETKQNSIRYLRLFSHTPEARTSIETCFRQQQHTDLIHLSCIPAFKIHMHGGLRLRHNTGNTSVLNHEGEPMDITKSTCKLCAIVMPVNVLTSVIQKVKVKKLMEFSNAALTAHILSETEMNLLQHVLITV